MTKKRSFAMLISFATLVVIAVGALALCLGEKDSGPIDARAYEFNEGNIALDDALDRAEIILPSCMGESLRFGLTDDGTGYHSRIYLELEGSVTCINSFLKSNSLRDANGVSSLDEQLAGEPVRYQASWMLRKEIKVMEWNFSSDQLFQEFGGTTQADYPVRSFVRGDPGSSTYSAYVYAFHGG